jgi:hypothetical protein
MERKNRTLVEMARTMLDKHRTPRRFWADAISTACYISNRIFLHLILHLTFDETAPCPCDVFECVGDKEMEECIFVDE